MIDDTQTPSSSSQQTSSVLYTRNPVAPYAAAIGIFLILGGLIASDKGLWEVPGNDMASQNIASASGTSTVNISSETIQEGDPFAQLTLEAEAAYVLDATQDTVLFAKNADKRLPLASLVKLMTVLVAANGAPDSTTITVGADDVAMDGDTGLLVGEKWRLSNLADYTLITSSNDGASALAATIGSQGQVAYDMSRDEAKKRFVARMNQTAQDLGLTRMSFSNATGLDTSTTTSGAYGTAQEVGELMRYLITERPSLVERTSDVRFRMESRSGASHIATNTNVSADELSGLIASKTGYTDLAGGNLVVAFDVGIGRPVVAVVLGSSYEGRFADMRSLVDATRRAVAQEH